MTTPPAPDATPGAQPDDAAATRPRSAAGDANAPERRVLRAALRDTGLFLAALAVLGVAVGALVAGRAGVWGALVGVALSGFFCATTIWSMLRSVGASPTAMAGIVMGTWVAKIVVLIAVLAVLRGRDFYQPWVLLVVVAVGAIGSSLLDYRAVTRGRVPYVQP
ncbi:hypothetical protein [Xylanimonas ulmi]|uniref:ATP synthase protein I n=1 Tax=Xylanimonas ulmi TaxID=228973 RepID=A0A4Q7M152_9MICO|nr:hypothetical protein [Xylanibacterium ulmi]RZS60098.1 hypothetical protein EV386_0340 [Xylanibacterium ulmi]